MADLKTLSREEIATHNTRKSCWVGLVTCRDTNPTVRNFSLKS
jgi:hypothetical protein